MCKNNIELWFCMQVYFLANTLRSYDLLTVFLITGQSQEIAWHMMFLYGLNESDVLMTGL